jgi:hypothetical protein
MDCISFPGAKKGEGRMLVAYFEVQPVEEIEEGMRRLGRAVKRL